MSDNRPARQRRTIDLTEFLADQDFLDRFWSKVDKTEDCWTWNRYQLPGGYGIFTVRKDYHLGAHRVAFALANGGRIDPGKHICHRCDNPPCVRPDHLFLGDARVNAIDSIEKGRGNRSHGEAHRSARLTEADVLYIRSQPRKLGLIPQLSEQFGVSRTAIKCARYGTTWTRVAA